MVIRTGRKSYENTLDYVKAEKPEFYRVFLRHCQEKQSVLPEMAEQQYLLWVTQKMKRMERTKLQELDVSLVSEEEVQKLETILISSPAFGKAMQEYADVRDMTSYLTKGEKKELEEALAQELHERMARKGRPQYSVSQLVVTMPKLNLGPWKRHTKNNHESGNVLEFIASHSELFKKHQEIAVRLVERYYEVRIQGTRTIKEARRILEELLKKV